MFHGRIDQDDRNAALMQLHEVLVRSVGLGCGAATEDHTRHLLLEQHPDILGLRHTASGAGAQHRREAALRQPAAHDLGQRRKDRVRKLGQDEPDQPDPVAAQQGRSLIAQHVERGEDGVASRRRDARLAVQHPADGRLAHADLRRDVR